jgi:hypothetical protein
MIEVALRSMLLADATVAGFVGTRVYVGRLPQSPTYPAIVLEPVTEDDNNTINTPGDLRWARIEVNAWAVDFDGVNDLHAAINAALNGNAGVFNGVDIRACSSMIGGRYFYEDSVKAHRRLRDYSVWHRPAA